MTVLDVGRSDSGPPSRPPQVVRPLSARGTETKPKTKNDMKQRQRKDGYTAPPPVPPEKYLPVKTLRRPESQKPSTAIKRPEKIFGHFDDGFCVTSPKFPPGYHELDEDGGRASLEKETIKPKATAKFRSTKVIVKKDLPLSQLDSGASIHSDASSILSAVGEKVSAIQRAQKDLEARLGQEYFNVAP
jgi:hypothetical protein